MAEREAEERASLSIPEPSPREPNQKANPDFLAKLAASWDPTARQKSAAKTQALATINPSFAKSTVMDYGFGNALDNNIAMHLDYKPKA